MKENNKILKECSEDHFIRMFKPELNPKAEYIKHNGSRVRFKHLKRHQKPVVFKYIHKIIHIYYIHIYGINQKNVSLCFV